jgi:hypothetical protein
MNIEIACYNFRSVRFMLKDKSKKLEVKKYVLKYCVFPVLVQGAEKPALRRRKSICSNLVSGRWKGECSILCGATTTNAEVRQRTKLKDIVALSRILK